MYRNVYYLGYVDDDVLIKSYQESHILVAPSRSRYEEFLLTPLEAQACGTPVVVSDIPGPRDYIYHGKTGFLSKILYEDFVKYVLYFKELWEKRREVYEQFSQRARENALRYD